MDELENGHIMEYYTAVRRDDWPKTICNNLNEPGKCKIEQKKLLVTMCCVVTFKDVWGRE